jgi:hypothetical protein
LLLHFFQIQRRDGMMEWHDLDQFLPKCAIKEGIGFGARYAGMFNCQIEGFVVLDLQIVIIDAIECKA